MKRHFAMFFIFASLATIQAAEMAEGEVIDKVAVVVNSEIITQAEIDRAMEPIYTQYRGIYSDEELVDRLEEARQKVIEQLIEDKLLLSEAKKQNIEIDEKDLEARIEDAKKRFGSVSEFERALEAQGMTVKELRQRYKEQMMTRKVVDYKVGGRININPIEVSEYYEKNKSEFVQPEEIKLKNILIRPKQDVPIEKTIELANDVLRKIKEGQDFAALAKEYSEGPYSAEGGGMGYVKKGDLLPEIEKVVFNMKELEVSGIVQTSLGYHIFKVEEKSQPRTKELAEVRRDIEDTLFRIKIKDKVKDWVAALKKNAYIAFK